MNNPYQAQIDLLATEIAENKSLLADPELAELAQQEIANLEAQKQQLSDAADLLEIEKTQISSSAQISKNCTLEIRPGTGGDEAKIWANDLLRMYVRYAEQLKLKITYIDDTVVKISGKSNQVTAYQIFGKESGVHRVQRIPATESQGRIHTSTASVAVLPEVSPTAIEIRDEDLVWQFMRASGAGGQSVNKTSSAVRLIHKPTGLTTTSRQEKKQEQNRKIALEHLRSQLWQIEEDKRLAAIGDARSVIGRNMRAEKSRTFNFPQNRVTDHRINKSWYNLESILEGNLEELISTVRAEIEKIEAEESLEVGR